MKRFAMAVLLLAALTGCSTNTAPQNTANAVNQTSNANADNGAGTNNTSAAGNTDATGNAAGGSQTSTTDATQMSDADLKAAVHDAIEHYIRSHNDKTIEEYKVDVQQFEIPGLASFVGQSATKGVDYAHPVQAYTINVTQAQAMNQNQVRGQAKVHLQYKGDKPIDVVYHVMLMQSNGDWLIASIA